MALATDPFTYAIGSVAAPGTSVPPTFQPPDNCHTIIVQNPSKLVDGYVSALVAAPAPLTPGINATRVPAGGSATLAPGPLKNRGPLTLSCDQAAGAPVALEFTYINLIGSEG